jgi:hypothetical protein
VEQVKPMGRPKIDNPKNKQYMVRIDKDDQQLLKENCEYYKETSAESLRRGIREVNEGIKIDKR